ncbi:His Kinase A (phospho-acceptor) domain-containing protein [Parafilimonas terrae]|uniref:histidine kinase n=2 Tax=Parafilimonas terrae TaxID=1465490 RepID=A0A1I5Z7T4_9BACT|nr:His Kinase A (phospho-acceptor) domain-containing protein [Parafilimonas terrae]
MNMSLQFALIVIIITYLRRTLQTKTTMPEWHRRLSIIMFAAIGSMVLQLSVASFSATFNIIFAIVEDLLVGLLLYIIYKQEEFKPVKFLLIALLPYAIVSVLDDILHLPGKNFYSKIDDIAGTISLFAVIWGFGVWMVSRRQQKELTKARQKALDEQENNRIITAMKAELEVQVAERTAELTQQKEALENTLSELKSTQAQLIQSEKMASLGELTAGIAHEIQNPLNFINNFSEVNNELIDELKQEWLKPDEQKDKTLEDELLADIIANNEKIAFHGKRADGIVKGMLQHSRKSSGTKEPTDINALCDEYLRLSYHGLRAKDKSFNAEFKTDLDESIGKISLVPQDIGRVLLNLLNNAFYAVNDKKKTAGADYKPMVIIQTKKTGEEGIEIKVIDNGKGIPQNVINKIFQPFFTTKPTGEGTGLGLSLTYDIITKQHNGSINVESKEGEGTAFIINLPVTVS